MRASALAPIRSLFPEQCLRGSRPSEGALGQDAPFLSARCSFSLSCDPRGLWSTGEPVLHGSCLRRALHVPARFQGALWHRGYPRGFPYTTVAHLGEAGSSCPSPHIPREACGCHQQALS